MNSLYIPIILGATRERRKSENIAKLIFSKLKLIDGITTEIVDTRDYKLEFDDSVSIPEFSEIVKKANAFVLVFPEYNHGIPGKLKSLLDTEFDEYSLKPVALASVSDGQFGGVRAVEMITPVLTNFGMVVTGITLHVPYVDRVIDQDGKVIDDKITERVDKFIQKLLYITNVITDGKKNNTS
jgi:NAD(P)H-dependent FMN reductase